jgi:hypothetical protein
MDPQTGQYWEDTDLPQLLKHDGSFFSAMVYVRSYLPPYTRDYYEETTVGTNEVVRTWLGDPQNYSDGFTISVWGAGAYVEVMEASMARETNGILTLRVPELGGTGGSQYSITCAIPPMERIADRRFGYWQMFSAPVENVKIIGSASL